MQGNDAIEVVAPLGGGISEVALLPDAAAVLASTAGVLVDPGRSFHAAGRHLSSLESDVALFVRRVEIPVIGRDGEIGGVLCRNSPLTSASRSTPLTQDQHTAIIGEATKAILYDITNLLATIDCGLRFLERQTEVEGRQLIVDRMRHSVKSEVGVGTAVRVMLLPVSRPADGNSVDLSNSMEMEVSATDRTEYPAPATRLDRGSFRRLARCGGAPIGMLFALALAGCDGKAQSQAAAPPPPPVTVAQPVKRAVTDWDEFTGRFDAIQEVQVRARVGGFVNSVEFKDGDMVHAGDLLYIIDPRPFVAVAEQANGQLADARAKTELAKRELDRALTLVQTSAVSEQVVDQRRQALQAAHAAETIAEGALKAAQLNVEFTHVVAPITGRVSRHLVSVGNLVQGSDNGGSTLLTTIVSMDPIYIYFDADEATYLKNNKLWFEGKRPSSRDTPNPVQVALTGETKPSHEGHMDFIDNRLDVSTGTLRSRAIIPNHDLSILPGQFGRVLLIGSSPYEALLLPDTAIATDQSRKIVFVVKDDNTVEARAVELGLLDEGLRVVRTGLKPEDRVIIDGIQRARVGAKVTPHKAEIGGGKS